MLKNSFLFSLLVIAPAGVIAQQDTEWAQRHWQQDRPRYQAETQPSVRSPALHSRAVARSDWAGWHAGPSVFHITGLDLWEDGAGIGGRAGYLFRMSPQVLHGPSVDLAFATFEGDGFDADFDILTGLTNYQFVVELAPRWLVYGGAGLGWAQAEVSADGLSAEDNALARQVFAGVEWKVIHIMSVRLGYRHLWVDDLADQGLVLDGDDASLIEAGVTFWF